ncbi:MAG: serine/threonine protein kinase [Chitinispirillaceae bacterium]
MSFETLMPESVLEAVEQAAGLKLTSFIYPLPSYINRVYELRCTDDTKLVAKFYRPGRWSREAILDEHRFIQDCRDAEISVVAPVSFRNGETLSSHEDIQFAVFPKRSGRQLEINDDSDWIRLGSLLGRTHLAGEKRSADSRITISPRTSTLSDVEYLCSEVIPSRFADQYRTTAMRIIEISAPFFENITNIRIHGDCHRGNILDRLEEGYLLIDFDDMAMGPPVQDLWLLLPDRVDACPREIELFLEGYRQFRDFDRSTLRCIEPLRAMRMIYFLSWCSRQRNDFQFRRNFPDWGNDTFWQKEINDLREQLGFVMETNY